MFATQTKTNPMAKAKPKAEPTAADKVAQQPNPLWQSLAIRPVAFQAKLAISQPNDPHEEEADKVAREVLRSPLPLTGAPLPLAPAVNRKCAGCLEEDVELRRQEASPSSVQSTISSQGNPLSSATREFFEPRFGHDFSHVRVHTDDGAAASARSVNALAYTVGTDIVFGSGQYAPETAKGSELLAHELTHVTQQAQGHLALQRQQVAVPAAPAPAHQPRADFVFIMGQDRPRSGNPFYREAERYFRAHVPAATFVTNLRTLDAVLNYIAHNVTQPIGNLYIVSHANEDGTLSFGLNAADQDTRLSLPELRGALHPAGGGASVLTHVARQIDAQTRIHIKGCDIGRTPGMVELIDEAFGGLGTVTAPTHEQGYGEDPTLAAAERTRVHDQMMATFTAGLAPIPPTPPAVDPRLRGAARTQALAERQAAVRARQQAITQRQQAIRREEQRIVPNLDRAALVAGRYEQFSGPMFQHTGTNLFTVAQLRPQVDHLYPHLSDAQRLSLVRRLVARDGRAAALADHQGTFQQQGQRAYRLTPQTFNFTEPRNLAEANRALAGQFRRQNFRARVLRPMQRNAVQGGTELTLEIEGQAGTGRAAVAQVMTFTFGPIPGNATLIAQGRSRVPNPDRYAWRVEERHNASGQTTRTVVAERVVAYLHHGSLNRSPHSHFTRPETDADFFATSTFAPPAAPARPGAQAPPAARPAAPAHPVQPKLAVSQPGDPFEQEADRVADRVMRFATNPSPNDLGLSGSAGESQKMQRKCGPCEEEEQKVQRSADSSYSDSPGSAPALLSNSGGHPLDPPIRDFMERQFGHNFGDVQVHTNSAAAESARGVNALAYTISPHIVFGANQFAPETRSGQRLLAHELAHVVQQQSAGGGPVASMVMREAISLRSSHLVTDVAPRAVDNKREEVLELLDRLHVLWSIDNDNYDNQYRYIFQLPAGAQVPQTDATSTPPWSFQPTMDALARNRQPTLATPVINHYMGGLGASSSVGQGLTNNKVDVLAVQDRLNFLSPYQEYAAEHAAVMALTGPNAPDALLQGTYFAIIDFKVGIASGTAGWTPTRAGESEFGVDRFAGQTASHTITVLANHLTPAATQEAIPVSIFLPSGIGPERNKVFLFFSPGDGTEVSPVQPGTNATNVHAIRSGADPSEWIVIGIPGYSVEGRNGWNTIDTAGIQSCLVRAGRGTRIDALRLAGHSRGGIGLTQTVSRRLIDMSLVDRIIMLDQPHERLNESLARLPPRSRPPVIDYTQGGGGSGTALYAPGVRAIGFSRLIQDRPDVPLPGAVATLVAPILADLPPRGGFTTQPVPPGATGGRVNIHDWIRRHSAAISAISRKDIPAEAEWKRFCSARTATLNRTIVDQSPYFHVNTQDLMRFFGGPLIDSSGHPSGCGFLLGTYAHHLFVAEISDEMFT